MQRGDPLHPVRVQLLTAVLAQELVARHLGLLRHTQKLAFQTIQALADLLELNHQLLDAVVVQVDRLHLADHLQTLLLVGALGPGRDQLATAEAVQTPSLDLMQLLIKRLDLFEVGEHLGLQLLLKRR